MFKLPPNKLNKGFIKNNTNINNKLIENITFIFCKYFFSDNIITKQYDIVLQYYKCITTEINCLFLTRTCKFLMYFDKQPVYLYELL